MPIVRSVGSFHSTSSQHSGLRSYSLVSQEEKLDCPQLKCHSQEVVKKRCQLLKTPESPARGSHASYLCAPACRLRRAERYQSFLIIAETESKLCSLSPRAASLLVSSETLSPEREARSPALPRAIIDSAGRTQEENEFKASLPCRRSQLYLWGLEALLWLPCNVEGCGLSR